MKKIVLLLLVFVSGYSQGVTLPDLLLLQSKPANEIKQYLTNAKWKLVDERFSDQHQFGDMTFVSTQSADAAPMYVKILYGQQNPSQTRLQLTIKNKEQFAAIKSGIQSTDLKFISTETVSNLTTTTFKNEKCSVRIVAERPVGAAVSYEIYIQSNTYDPKMYNFSLGK
jgi:hypothetical protein